MISRHALDIFCIEFAGAFVLGLFQMTNVHELESFALVDMLAEYTQRYTNLFKNFINYDEEFQTCKKTLECIIIELDRRKMLPVNNDTSILKGAI